MAPPLTIRNVTSTALTLKKVEHFEVIKPEEPTGFNLTSIAHNVTKAVNQVAGYTDKTAALPENAQSFETNDVDISVDPFTTKITDINVAIRGATDVLRLTFECDGQRYQVDVPSPGDRSAEMKSLDGDPRHRLTAVYQPAQAHVCIVSSANLSSWMNELKDHVPLSAISMPGTHNSPTSYIAPPSVRCQAVSLKEQLENGVRFLDLRVQPEDPANSANEGLILVHAVFPISLTGAKYFRPIILDVINEFLEHNPSETIVISLKREGPGKATDADLCHLLKQHYINDDNRWFTEPRVPKLGEVRKKIVLFRRFGLTDELRQEHDGRGWGIDAQNWADNTPNSTSGDVCVQDFYEVLETENIEKKITYVEAHLAEASGTMANLDDANASQPLFINFLSASNFWKTGCWPDKIAAKINPAIVQYLCQKHHVDNPGGDGGTGVVICDWVGNNGDWDLVRCIVAQNAKLEMRG